MATKKFFKTLRAATIATCLSAFGLAFVACESDQTEIPEGPETGVYYCDVNGEEYLITLNSGNKFAFVVDEANKSGVYTVSGETLTLDFNADADGVITAVLNNGVVTLTYDNQEMRFLKKVPFTVSFDENDGSEVADVTVINGKTVAKPADPTKEGYSFVGWYADEDFDTPYLFSTQVVTANTTIYARWTKKLAGEAEYDVKFETGAADVAAPAAVVTKGGAVYELPTLTREGYTFAGWWVSDTQDAEKLTRRYEEGTVLTQDTTLFALWTQPTTDGKIASPLVDVNANGISWNSVANATTYFVEIEGPEGFTFESQTVGSTNLAVDFAKYPEGEYTVKVTARAASAANNSVVTVRNYTNKALARVSSFTVVEPSVINFAGVENAESYYITIVCGNEQHNHEMLNNGASTNYSFVNCEMKDGGIEFTVTAVANGYASSTSDTFTYERTLNAVEGLKVDEQTQTLVWNAVAEATNYMVSVRCGNADHDHALVDNGSKTSFSLKTCAPCEGGITVEVYPFTKGYNTPAATSFVYNKTTIATPDNLRIIGNMLTWNTVANATEYEVKVGNVTQTVQTNEFDLTTALAMNKGQAYEVSVRAKGETNSLWSDVLDARYLALANSLKYEDGVVSWDPVIGAMSYYVRVNGVSIDPVADGSGCARVTLTKAGDNEIEVRFYDGEGWSNDVVINVFAYTVEFDARLGASVEKQYKALGDTIELPTTTRAGYAFNGWYNVPGGSAANGARYVDAKVTEIGDMVLYADWVSGTFEITYNKGGSVGDSEGLKTTVVYGQPFQFDVPEKEAENKTFVGWYSSTVMAEETRLTNERGESIGVWDIPQDTMVYAYWRDAVLEYVPYGNGYAVQKGADVGEVNIITIPAEYNEKPVIRVEAYAFKYCSSLKEINIPNTVTEIETSSFYSCSNLEKIEIYDAGAQEPVYYSKDGILIRYNVTTQSHELVCIPGKLTGEVTIPEGVTELPNQAFAKSTITKIILPASLQIVQYRAFYNCKNLTEVTILDPAGNASGLAIAAEAFENCPALTRVNLPARTTSLATDETLGTIAIFKDCPALTSVVFPAQSTLYKTIDGVVCSTDGSQLIFFPYGKTSTSEGGYTIPDTVTAIASYAFNGCNSLTEVTIHANVRTIGAHAFDGMKALTTVNFDGPGFVDLTIGESAFANCANLKTVNFDADVRVKTISASAFANCGRLTGFVLPDSVTTIGNKAFENCLGLMTMNIPVDMETVALGAFAGCDNLDGITVAPGNANYVDDNGVLYEKDTANNVTYNKILFYSKKKGNITLPNETTAIGDNVFANNKNITTFTVGVNVTSIGENAFDGCTALAEVIFTAVTPDAQGAVAQTLTLGEYAFANCTALTKFEFPKHAINTGDYVLYKSTKVKDVTFLSAATTIGTYALAYTAIDEIELPADLTAIPNGLFEGCAKLTDVDIPANVKTIGTDAFKDAGLTTLVLPAALEVINPRAFMNAKIQTVNLPATLKTIGNEAFMGSDITTIAIPASVTVIGTSVFQDTTKMTTATIAADSTLTTIPEYMFAYSSVQSINIPASVTLIGVRSFYYASLENITIADGEKDLKIGDYAFYKAALGTVDLPDRLTEVGGSAFYECMSLTEVNISETSRLKKLGNYAFAVCENLEYFFIPKTVTNTVSSKGAYNGYGLGTYLFMSNDLLKTVEFQGGGIIDIANGQYGVSFNSGMFLGCNALETLILPDHLDAYSSSYGPFKDDTFSTHPKLQITVRENSTSNYKVVGGILYSLDGTQLIKCPASNTGVNGVITIPATVTSISVKAFYNCTEITEIAFEASTEPLTIGNNAFDGCTALTTFTLPTRVTSVGTYAFRYCQCFKNVTFDFNQYPSLTTVSNYMFYGTNLKGVILSPNITTVGTYAFDDCTELTSVDFTQATALTKLDTSSFYGCTALTAVEIPASVTEIKGTVFKGCTSLSNITFAPNSQLAKLNGTEIFAGTAITSIVFPDSLTDVNYGSTASGTRVGVGQFNDCPNLTSITISKNLKADKVIGLLTGANKLQKVITPEGCVNFNAIDGVLYSANGETLVWYPAQKQGTTYTINGGVTTIAPNAFSENPYLTKISIPDSVTSIGVFAFINSTALTELVIPAGVTTIPNDMALNCASLKTVTLKGEVTKVGDYAFRNCGELQTINLPGTVTTIGKYTFESCSKLTGVQLTESLTSLGDYAFRWCTSFTELVIPKTVKTIGANPFAGLAKTDVIIDPANPNFLVEDGFIYNAKKTTLIYVSNSVTGEVVIPNSVTEIDGGAFANCENITDVICGTGLATIDMYAFQNSSVTSVTFKTYVELSGYAFAECSNLKEIKGVAPRAWRGNTFENCTALEEITLGVSSGFYGRQFAGCTSLKKVVCLGPLTSNASSFMSYSTAFEGCTAIEEIWVYTCSMKPYSGSCYTVLPSTCTLYFMDISRIEDWDPAISSLYLDGFTGKIECLG